ncbi:MAG: PEP-utilizing enzyme [Candidatus Magasanikbacteria bacterium]
MNIQRIIAKYNLQLSSQREMSLFSASCVFLAYVKLSKKILGFTYNTAAYISFGNGVGTFIVNEIDLKNKVADYVAKFGISARSPLFLRADKIFVRCRDRLCRPKEWVKNNPLNFLMDIVNYYPQYFVALNVYNVFWKFIGNDEKIMLPEVVKLIATNRNRIAELYPIVEKLLMVAVKAISKQGGFDGGVLLSMTLREMKMFLKSKKISKLLINELKARQQAFLYATNSTCSKDYIITDKKFIKKTYNNLLSLNTVQTEVRGFGAYPGQARGRVYLLPHRAGCLPPANFVIVANSTHPKYLPLIKKCQAIVAEEGGILSHAAIISRELKKPCIVGARNATKIFNEGDMVEVDAVNGVVKKMY